MQAPIGIMYSKALNFHQSKIFVKNQPKSYRRKEAILVTALTVPIWRKTVQLKTGLRTSWTVRRCPRMSHSSFIKTSLKVKALGVVHLGNHSVRMQY